MILMHDNTNDNTPSKCDMHTCTHVFAFCVCTDWISSLLKNTFLALSLSQKETHVYILYLYYKQFITFIILAECRATHRAASFKLCHWSFRFFFFFSADGLFLKPLSTTQVTPAWIKQPYASHVWIRFSSHICFFSFSRDSFEHLLSKDQCLGTRWILKVCRYFTLSQNEKRATRQIMEDLRRIWESLVCTIEFAPLGDLIATTTKCCCCSYYYFNIPFKKRTFGKSL